MKTMHGDGAMKSKRTLAEDLLRVAVGTALVLMVPLVAMQFDSGVDWSASDFVRMGVLLGGTGLMYVALARNVTTPRQRAMVGAALVLFVLFVLFVLLCWVKLAVGVFGSPFAGS